MEFVQSRFQDIFSRFYELVCEFIVYGLIAFCVSVVLSEEITFGIYLWISVATTLGPLLYVLFIYRQAAKTLYIGDDKLVYTDRDTEAWLAWKDFAGYRISRTIPHRVIIKNRKYADLRFSYYAFSAAQRRQIFALLDDKIRSADQDGR